MDLSGMNPQIDRCSKCDRLLIAFGEAVRRFHETKNGPRQSESETRVDYERLRARLLRHLNQHEFKRGQTHLYLSPALGPDVQAGC